MSHEIEAVLQRLTGRAVEIYAISDDRRVTDLANGALADVVALRRALGLPNDAPISLARPQACA